VKGVAFHDAEKKWQEFGIAKLGFDCRRGRTSGFLVGTAKGEKDGDVHVMVIIYISFR
jgi:hypothetical protein